MNKAFTLRLVRCLLVGFGAFVMILAFDITIRSPLDVAGYVLGAGALWYIFELIAAAPRTKQPRPLLPPQQTSAPKNAKPSKRKEPVNPLGEDHFD